MVPMNEALRRLGEGRMEMRGGAVRDHPVGVVYGRVAYGIMVTHSSSCHAMRSRRAGEGAMGSDEALVTDPAARQPSKAVIEECVGVGTRPETLALAATCSRAERRDDNITRLSRTMRCGPGWGGRHYPLTSWARGPSATSHTSREESCNGQHRSYC